MILKHYTNLEVIIAISNVQAAFPCFTITAYNTHTVNLILPVH